jgi:2-keto-4-pentenoate hydratase
MTESHRSTSDTTRGSKPGDAAQILWQAWSSGHALESLPRELRPEDLAEGYAVQRALDDLAGPPTGWKIAATSQAGQQHLGASGPMVGRLYRSQARSSGASLSVRNMRMRSAEPEFAFVLAQDLKARDGELERADVLAAVGSLVLAIEVPDSRFVDFKAVGVPSLAADAMCGGHYICGPAIEEWRSLDLARQSARLLCGGEERSAGSGAAVLGDPRDALTWMANEVLGRGWELAAGEIIMTGASSPPLAVDAGDVIEAVFDGLGSVRVTFTA